MSKQSATLVAPSWVQFIARIALGLAMIATLRIVMGYYQAGFAWVVFFGLLIGVGLPALVVALGFGHSAPPDRGGQQ